MKINETELPGCYELVPHIFKDERGLFVKTFHEEQFREKGLVTHFGEEYYSFSHKGVLRGLHFQTPPMDHAKMVYCVSGEVIDAVVDLRVGSPAYGKYALFDLNSEKCNIIYIPSGMAHGFYVTSESALLMYKVTTVYSPEHDSGIHWRSAGIPWGNDNPQISKRDGSFPSLADFKSPFQYN
ncbi:MAG: dTDP-4-dehydrorhamnose 3,5-epimerase [Deltaproteobacteria bacterium]|nr:dTDP-4-dehydrorhamnose 3,5-epimerase [Deltaproteobacteria bacterium]